MPTSSGSALSSKRPGGPTPPSRGACLAAHALLQARRGSGRTQVRLVQQPARGEVGARAAAAGSPAPPPLPQSRPARLIGCGSEGRRRGGRGGLISDADSLLLWLVRGRPPRGGDGWTTPAAAAAASGGRLWGRAPSLGAQPAAARNVLPHCCRERRWRNGLPSPGPTRLGPCVAGRLSGARGRGRAAVSRTMERSAAAGGASARARRWIPWLGLCFWAAGAAAARG